MQDFYLSNHAFFAPSFKSIPLKSMVKAVGSKSIFTPAVFGQLKRPFSRRFAKTHTPEPSQNKILTRSFSLFVKQNISLSNGLSLNLYEAIAHSPLNCFRISIGSTAMYIL